MTVIPSKVQRAHGGNRLTNSLRLGPTFCIVEFLDNSDSTLVKRRWESFGFRDVTPRLGNPPSRIITFRNDRYAEKWEEFQDRLKKVSPDWFYISGHHSSQHSTSIDYEDDGKKFPDYSSFFQNQVEVGFFNERYHLGRFMWDRGKPDKAIKSSPLEVYMSSTGRHSDAGLRPWPDQPPFQKSPANPLFGELSNPFCRGLLLVGCNTLTFRIVRRTLARCYPEAVVIGLLSKNSASAIPLINKIFRICGGTWFRDPQKDPFDPSKELDLLNLTQKLNYPVGRIYRRLQDVVAVMFKNKYSFPVIIRKTANTAVLDSYMTTEIDRSFFSCWLARASQSSAG